MPLSLQAKLLRVLQEKIVTPLGSQQEIPVDVRVVATTNRCMAKEIESNRFREDLFYRLSTVEISLPPLRERKEDITLLFRKFASDFAQKYKMPTLRLDQNSEKILTQYNWEGNIRQLKNVAEQISVLEKEREVVPEVLKNNIPEKHHVEILDCTLSEIPSDSPELVKEFKKFNPDFGIVYFLSSGKDNFHNFIRRLTALGLRTLGRKI